MPCGQRCKEIVDDWGGLVQLGECMRNSILLHSSTIPPLPDMLSDRLKAAMEETGRAAQAIALWVEKKASEAEGA